MEIEQTRLGRTNLQVTKLGLGAYQFTNEFNVDPEEADKILDYAIEAGINYIDTAQMYGFGESEQLVGRAMARHPEHKISVSTKVGYLDRSISRNAGEKGLQNYKAIMRTIKHSLWLLRRDYLEVLMVHEPNINEWWGFDYETGDAVIMDVLEDLKKEGTIGAIGMGGWVAKNITQLINTGRFDVALVAGGMRLVGPTANYDELIQATKKHDTGLIVGSAFGGGFFHELLTIDWGIVEKLEQSEEEDKVRYGRKIRGLYEIAEELDMPIIDLAIRYLLANDDIHVNIAGAREVGHIMANVATARKGRLEDKYVQRINQLQKL